MFTTKEKIFVRLRRINLLAPGPDLGKGPWWDCLEITMMIMGSQGQDLHYGFLLRRNEWKKWAFHYKREKYKLTEKAKERI